MDHNQASLLEFEEVAKVLGTDLVAGLSLAEVQPRLARYGPNRLDEVARMDSAIKRYLWDNVVRFLKQFLNPLIQLLLLCVIISLAIGECENSISIMVAVLLVCTISYVQERRADKSLEKLAGQMPSKCKVIRDGQAYEIEADQLVPGDVVHLSEGQRVPADLRLYELHSLAVNEANLTGETQTQLKCSQAIQQELTNILKRGYSSVMADNSTGGGGSGGGERRFIYQNLALMGTVVESGHSRGLVIATGKSTRYGEVFSMLKSTQQPKSPLQTNIDQLSLHLVVCSCLIIAAISVLGIVQQRPPFEVIYYAISLAVTAIPEGLPVVVAVIMALGVIRLSHQKTIVKSLTSIETLGCIQILCSDKTGTLTRNDMTLTDIVTSELHSISSSELEELNNEECMKQMTFNRFGGKMCSLGRVMEVGTLCNNATVDQAHSDRASGAGDGSQQDDCSTVTADGGGSYRYIGQATECAILDAAIRLGFGDSRTKYERILEIPFTPASRRMAVKCRRRDQPGQGPMFYVKGAWEEILRDCQHYYECGLVRARTDEMWREYGRICVALGSQGLRVLGLATGASLDQLTFVGLVGINNQLRDGMVDTICKLRERFHIDVKMITGDSRATAVAVGKQLGLIETNYYSSPLSSTRLSGRSGATGSTASTLVTTTNNNNNNTSSSISKADLTSVMGVAVNPLGPSHPAGNVYDYVYDECVYDAYDDDDDSDGESRYVMSGDQLQRLLNKDMDQALKSREILSKSVFYRVDPIQKANIVSKLQDLNKVVAMTGDGVNDIISLKRANLSLVMGSGADVCKEIADVIIMDDDLSVLLPSVIEGKGIYHKIHTFMAYQMSISLTLVLLIAVAFGTQSEPPFTVIQLLLVNILADGPPAQALGMEQLSENELCLWPRNANDPILSCRLLGTLLVLTLTLFTLNGCLYQFLLDDENRLDDHARALLFSCFVFCTIFAALSLKSKFKTVFETRLHANKHLLYCCLAIGLIQVALTQINGLNAFFQLDQLKPLELLYVFLYAALVLLVMDGIKVLARFVDYAGKLALKMVHCRRLRAFPSLVLHGRPPTLGGHFNPK
jgi:magnesium-transporting ATPase (P-type)